MREKLQTLPLTELKELAKAQGMKGLSGMKKSEIIDLLCQRAKEMETQKAEENNSEEQKEAETPAVSAGRQEKTERTVYVRRTGRGGQPEHSEGGSQQEYAARPERMAQTERPERSDRVTQAERPERPDRTIQTDRQPVRRDPAGAGNDTGLQDTTSQEMAELDSGVEANGILEVMPDGFGFIRCENFLPGENDVYVAPSQIRRFNMKTGDIIVGSRRIKTAQEKFAALLYIRSVNGMPPSVLEKRPNFEDLTPVFPNERLHMETAGRAAAPPCGCWICWRLSEKASAAL